MYINEYIDIDEFLRLFRCKLTESAILYTIDQGVNQLSWIAR